MLPWGLCSLWAQDADALNPKQSSVASHDGSETLFCQAAVSLHLVWTTFRDDGEHCSGPYGSQSIQEASGVEDGTRSPLLWQWGFAHALGRGLSSTPNLSPGRDINPAPAEIIREAGFHGGEMGR